MTALERDPQQRWQHATALRSALTTLTRRLALVASDADVVTWLDWLFAQAGDATRQSVDDGASASIHIEQGTNVHAGISAPAHPSQLHSVPTLMISGAPPVGAPRPFGIPPGQFDDAVPTLVRASAPRMIATDAVPRPALARSSSEQRATPVPPNRESPIALTPPVRASGRLDERTGIMRAPPQPRSSSELPPPVQQSSQAFPTPPQHHRPSQAYPTPPSPRSSNPRVLPMAPGRGPGMLATVILVLVIAAGVGSAVYFLLPRVLE